MCVCVCVCVRACVRALRALMHVCVVRKQVNRCVWLGNRLIDVCG